MTSLLLLPLGEAEDVSTGQEDAVASVLVLVLVTELKDGVDCEYPDVFADETEVEDSTGQDDAVASVLVERKEEDVELGWLLQEDDADAVKDEKEN